MSAPAANAFSPPASTMQRTSLVAVRLLERVDDEPDQLVVERVQPLGTVHRHEGDRALALGQDELSSSRFSRNLFTAACGSSVAIERASQSRAWLIVSCQARSFQKFRCCFA